MMFDFIANAFHKLFPNKPPAETLNEAHRTFLTRKVTFYRQLNEADKAHFEACCIAFIKATQFVGHETEVTDEDMLLVAAGSVILAWGFPKWYYVKANTSLSSLKCLSKNTPSYTKL